MGSTDTVTVNGEFNSSTAYAALGNYTLTGSGLVLDAQLSTLVSAMASFETSYQSTYGVAFDPTASANAVISDSTVLAAVNSDWHVDFIVA